jgi:hypothetical protein
MKLPMSIEVAQKNADMKAKALLYRAAEAIYRANPICTRKGEIPFKDLSGCRRKMAMKKAHAAMRVVFEEISCFGNAWVDARDGADAVLLRMVFDALSTRMPKCFQNA